MFLIALCFDQIKNFDQPQKPSMKSIQKGHTEETSEKCSDIIRHFHGTFSTFHITFSETSKIVIIQ